MENMFQSDSELQNRNFVTEFAWGSGFQCMSVSRIQSYLRVVMLLSRLRLCLVRLGGGAGIDIDKRAN